MRGPVSTHFAKSQSRARAQARKGLVLVVVVVWRVVMGGNLWGEASFVNGLSRVLLVVTRLKPRNVTHLATRPGFALAIEMERA